MCFSGFSLYIYALSLCREWYVVYRVSGFLHYRFVVFWVSGVSGLGFLLYIYARSLCRKWLTVFGGDGFGFLTSLVFRSNFVLFIEVSTISTTSVMT